MRNGEAGASRRNGSALAQTRRRKRGRALEPRRRSARLQAAAARGGPAASTRGTPAGGSAVDARRREGKNRAGSVRSTAARACAKKSHARTAGGVWRSSAVSARGIAATCKNWCRKHRTGTASAMAPSRCSVVRASRCCGGRETRRLVLHALVRPCCRDTRTTATCSANAAGTWRRKTGKVGRSATLRLRRSLCARARDIGEGSRGAPTVAGPVAGAGRQVARDWHTRLAATRREAHICYIDVVGSAVWE